MSNEESQFSIIRTDNDSGNGKMTFLFCLRKLSFQPRYLGVFLHLCLCKKFLQARYLFALFGDYLRLHGVSILHLRLQLQIVVNWAFCGMEYERVMFISNVK